jgi:hypothetical protein
MREDGGHEFESPQPRTRIFRVKNRVTCDLFDACVRASRGFSIFLTFLTLVCPPLVLVGITN